MNKGNMMLYDDNMLFWFKEQFLVGFWLDKSMYLTHFSQYFNFLAPGNLRKP